MKEANPFLSDEVAAHLTLHGTNWNADGSITWKFDNYVRTLITYGFNIDDAKEVMSRITCPRCCSGASKAGRRIRRLEGRRTLSGIIVW